MATITSNGTGGGNWSDGSAWTGGTAPGSGDRAVIQAGDVIYIDGNITIGDGSTSTSIFAVNCSGDLVWRNRTSDASSSWTFTVNGHMDFQDGSHWYIGTEDNTAFGTESVGPIPSTRTAKVDFSMQYYHRIRANNVDNADGFLEIWGAEDYHQGTAPSISSQSVDSAANTTSFVDAARTSDAANLWRGAWLEITSGTNEGEKREITAFDNSTGTITWSSNQPMPEACDNTSVYSITHNYQRALLQADASSGSDVTITLDRAADWEVGDTVAIAVGYEYATTERPDYVTIKTKISSTQYTVDLTYDHKAGDMVIHMDKNIKIYASDLTGASEGYYFYFYNSDAGARVNWAWFEDAGYSSATAVLYWNAAGECPTVRNCTAKGFLEGTSEDFGGYFVYRANLNTVSDEYLMHNIHVYNIGGIAYGYATPAFGATIEEQERCKFKEMTWIGATTTTASLANLPNNSLIPPTVENVWVSGRTRDSSSVRGGYIVSGYCNLNGFKGRQVSRGVYINGAAQSSLTTQKMTIENGEIWNTDNECIYLDSLHMGECHIKNVDMRRADDCAVYISDSASTVFFLKNNKYNDCRSTSEGALFLTTAGTGAVIHETDGEYGEDNANYGANVMCSNVAKNGGSFRYVSYNTKYNTPTSKTWTETLADNIFGIASGNTWENRVRTFFPTCSLEANNPTVNSVASNSVAIINGGGILEEAEHPTVPRTTSNVKMKITPYAAIGETKANLSVPFLAYASSSETVTATIYVRKNVTQIAGSRPKLHIWGNGEYWVDEMSDAIDTWEQLSVSYTAQFDGAFMMWITCSNNLKYAKSSTTGDAEYGEPDSSGTVVVYADELAVTVT